MHALSTVVTSDSTRLASCKGTSVMLIQLENPCRQLAPQPHLLMMTLAPALPTAHQATLAVQ